MSSAASTGVPARDTGENDASHHDLFVLSDLHMGRGINPDTRRYFTLENFFFDDDFAKLCRYLCEQAARGRRPCRLILNGDTFDLLRIDPEPSTTADRRERRFEPAHTPPQAAHTVRAILRGHPRFVHGLCDVLHAGHDVVFLPGNHDIEMQWTPVHAAVRDAIAVGLADDPFCLAPAQVADALARLQFRDWFYHEPNRIWVEHGCQYDPENSFRYLLRGRLGDLFEDQAGSLGHSASDTSSGQAIGSGRTDDPRVAAFYELEQDMPLGNFFQRYLYNAFGHITFIVPSTRANLRYVKWLLLNAPRLLVRVLFSHGPFVFQVLRRLGQQANPAARKVLADTHARALEELCLTSELGDKLRAIDRLKEVRADAVQAARSIGWQTLKFLAGVALIGVGVSALYVFCLALLSKFVLGGGTGMFIFLLMSPFIVTLAAIGGLVYTVISSGEDVSPRPLRRAAQRIAAALHVPVVSFGHSHDEEMWRLDLPSGGRAWYCNTGTWIAVFTHDVLIPRERVQYTFLRVRGEQAELLYWSPSRGEPMPVILLDEGLPTEPT